MTRRLDFEPDWVSSPGDTIADLLEERGFSVAEFAERLGHTVEKTNELLKGRLAITIAIARQLVAILGGSVEFWMSRDYQYREDAAKVQAIAEDWLSELPISEMIRFGWIQPPRASEELAACLAFFDVASVPMWREAYADIQEMVTFRTSPSFDSRPACIAAWLRQGEIEADRIVCHPWNPSLFRESLTTIRSLTKKKDPSQFLPELQACCAKSGVAVAVVRAPAGCRASGATRFLELNKALILLSFRYLSDDHFWFTFFHEAGHLLLHSKKSLFLEGTGTDPTTEEDEADEFAARILVPPEFQEDLLALRGTARDVIRFARHLGVAPGVIVGQLQHLGRLRHNQLNRLKRRFVWE